MNRRDYWNFRAAETRDFPPPTFDGSNLVMIAMTVPPIPVLFLLILVEVFIVAMRISVVFHDPLLVVDIFVPVPRVIVAVIRVVHAVSGASRCHQWYGQRAREKNQTEKPGSAAHFVSSLGAAHM